MAAKKKFVYAYWDSSPSAPLHQAALVVLWRRTWKAKGWTPRVLMAKTAAKHRGRGSPTYTNVNTMNICWRPKDPYCCAFVHTFPHNSTPDQVLAGLKKIQEEISALV